MQHFKEENGKSILFSGIGKAITKTVTCAEITKRKFKKLHQITKIDYTKIEEVWEPKIEGLDRLKVVRELPAIFILLSFSTLDETQTGYQSPQSYDALWKTEPSDKTHQAGSFSGGSGSRGRFKKKKPRDNASTSS